MINKLITVEYRIKSKQLLGDDVVGGDIVVDDKLSKRISEKTTDIDELLEHATKPIKKELIRLIEKHEG